MVKHCGWEKTIFWVLVSGENILLIGLSNAMMVIFFLSRIPLSIFLPLNPAIYGTGYPTNILCPRCKEQDESYPHPHFTFYYKLTKITPDWSELHKVSLKAITMGTSSQSHDAIHLNILPILLQVFLMHLFCCRRKAFNEGYDKINRFSNFKYNFVSQFNKLQNTATKLGSRHFWGPGTPF